jgi:hypothetical protein
MLLAARMKCYGCSGVRAVVFLASFSYKSAVRVFIKCELYFCFASIFNLQNKNLCYSNVRLILNTKFNAMYKPLATNAWLIQIQPIKLAVSPHFKMNISVPVI